MYLQVSFQFFGSSFWARNQIGKPQRSKIFVFGIKVLVAEDDKGYVFGLTHGIP